MSDLPPDRAPVPASLGKPAFLTGSGEQPLRILAEYLEPYRQFEKFPVRNTIVFFGSARILSRKQAQERLRACPQDDPEEKKRCAKMLALSRYYEATRALSTRLSCWSRELARANNDRERKFPFLVCSGGGPGIMEAANRGAKEAEMPSVSLRIFLPNENRPNPYVTPELDFLFHYFFMRKYWFTYFAKAIVIMPGGFGTLDELFEILTLLTTRKMRKNPLLLLYGGEFWKEILNFAPLLRAQVISRSDASILRRAENVDEAFAYITRHLTK